VNVKKDEVVRWFWVENAWQTPSGREAEQENEDAQGGSGSLGIANNIPVLLCIYSSIHRLKPFTLVFIYYHTKDVYKSQI
jgi:hypothetical protein